MPESTPVALITGAAQRLGAATARALHARGYRVLIHARSRQAQAEALSNELNALRADSAHWLLADLAELPAIEQLAKATCAHWARLDLLVNNASVFYPCPAGENSAADWDKIMHTNLRAPFFLTQACLPALRASHGCVVNLIDVYAERPLPRHPLYSASKAGLAMLTKALARDLAPEIRVNGVSPGAILWPEGNSPMDPACQQAILSKTPLQRAGHPDDIASAICWLACDAPYVTGQILTVDGGRSLNI